MRKLLGVSALSEPRKAAPVPLLDAPTDDEVPFLELKFYKNGRMTWKSEDAQRPVEYAEIKLAIGTITLVMHQLAEWGSNCMASLFARQMVDEELASFLEKFDPEGEKEH